MLPQHTHSIKSFWELKVNIQMNRKSALTMGVVFILGGIIAFAGMMHYLRSKGTLSIHPDIRLCEIKGNLHDLQKTLGLSRDNESIVVIRRDEQAYKSVQQFFVQTPELHEDDRLLFIMGYVPADCYYSVPAMHDTYCQLLLRSSPANTPEVQLYCIRIPRGVVIAPNIMETHPSYPLK